MPLQPNGSAPYTTAAAMTVVLDAWRDKGFGRPVTADTLIRAGVPESLARRTIQSMVLLDLLNEEGTPAQQFDDFRATRGDDEYRTRLQEWLRGVYVDVLQYADPSTDPYERVTEAFRTYEPAGQRRGMASLLVGLWKHAGLPVKAEGNGESRARRPLSRTPARGKKAPTAPRRNSAPPPADLGMDGLPPGLVGLLHQIPRNGRSWTTLRREDFMGAFGAVLDFSVPVDDRPVTEDHVEQEDES